ncbi:MAG: hypothetical protein PVG79_03035 [Gemmatimonadales bacterium]
MFRAVVRTVVPEADALDSAAWDDLDGLVSRSLHDRPPELLRGLRLLLRLVQWAPLFRFGRPFTRLDRDRRARFLAGLQSSRSDLIRVGFWGLRTLALLGYYGREPAARSIGYHPNPRGWEAAQR